MAIAIESILIVLIGLLDLGSTLFWVHHHGAQEANPLFSRYLAMGTAWFIVSKVVMLVAPVILLEWARRRRPRFTRWASRFAIAAYLSLYLVGVARLNPDLVKHSRGARVLAMLVPGETPAWADTAPGRRADMYIDARKMAAYLRDYRHMRQRSTPSDSIGRLDEGCSRAPLHLDAGLGGRK